MHKKNCLQTSVYLKQNKVITYTFIAATQTFEKEKKKGGGGGVWHPQTTIL